MPNYVTLPNIIRSDEVNGLQFYPSESIFSPTSSAPATSAEYELIFPPTLGGNLISDSEANPFIIIPIFSSSAFNSDNDEELIIRFFTSSHFDNKHTGSFSPKGSGFNVLSVSSSLYHVGTNTNVKYRDTFVNPGTKGSAHAISIRNIVHDLITGSSYHQQQVISASKQGNFTCSIHYTNINRGAQNTPTLFTGSLSSAESFLFITKSTGSGILNFSEPTNRLSADSASLSVGFDLNDPKSIVFQVGTASLGYDGSRANNTLLFFSSSGRVGFGTRVPKANVEISGSVKGTKLVTAPSGSNPKPIIIEDSEIKFYQTSQEDPNHPDYAKDKERARIKAIPGSFNLIFEVSGSEGYTKSVFISQSGRIGFNTDKPQSEFDARVSEAQFQRPGARKGLKINEEGNIESFNKELASAATGSEFVLRYSRGSTVNAEMMEAVTGQSFDSDDSAITFFNNLRVDDQNETLQRAEEQGFNNLPSVGDTIGSIRFVAESGSVLSGEGFNDRTTGEAASIQAVVHSADNTGVRGDLIFKVADQTGTSVQRMVLDAGDEHQLSGSLNIGATDSEFAKLAMYGPEGNLQAGFFRVGASSADLKIGRMLLHDNGTQKVQLSAKGKSFIAGTSGTGTTGTFLGINTQNPTRALQVEGSISCSNNFFLDGEIKRVTNITASGNISSSGEGYFNKVGIGTSFPAQDLHVKSSANYEGIFINGSNAPNITFRKGTSTTPTWKAGIAGTLGTAFSISEGTANDEKLMILPGGNVLIGATNGSEKLTVEGNISSSGNLISERVIIGESDLSRALTVNDTSQANGEQIMIQGSTSTGATIRYNRGASFSWRTGIGASGTTIPTSFFGIQQVSGNKLGLVIAHTTMNVGLGTTSPEERLTVSGSLRVFGEAGHITASGNISASGDITTSEEVAFGEYLRALNGFEVRNYDNTWTSLKMTSNGILELASGGNNDRGHLKLHADHGTSPRTSIIEFQNEARSGSFLFTDASQNLKFHTSDPGEDDSVGNIVLLESSDISTGNITASGNISSSGDVEALTFTSPTLDVTAGSAQITENIPLTFGNLVSGDTGKLNIKHDGSDGEISNNTGDLTINNSSGDTIIANQGSSGKIILAPNETPGPNTNSGQVLISGTSDGLPPHLKVEGEITASGNISSSGTIIANAITASNIDLPGDNKSITFDNATKLIGDHSVDGFQIRTQDATPIVFKTNGNNIRATIAADGEATFAGVLNSTKLNTGQGDNELYAMNQDVETTDGVQFATLRLTSTTDASATSTGHAFQAGLTSGTNVIIDSNEVMARNNGSTADLHLNPDGGAVSFNNSVSTKVRVENGHITASGNISSSGTIEGITGSFQVLVGDTSQDTSLEVDGPITASGDISSSGVITSDDGSGNGFTVRPNLYFFATNTSATTQTLHGSSAGDQEGSLPSTNTTTITLSQQQNSHSSVFSLSSNRLTIARAGLYKFTYNAVIEINNGSGRAEGFCGLVQETSGGSVTLVNGSEARGYHRFKFDQGPSGVTFAASVIVNVAANSIYDLRFGQEDQSINGAKLRTLPSGTSIIVEAIT